MQMENLTHQKLVQKVRQYELALASRDRQIKILEDKNTDLEVECSKVQEQVIKLEAELARLKQHQTHVPVKPESIEIPDVTEEKYEIPEIDFEVITVSSSSPHEEEEDLAYPLVASGNDLFEPASQSKPLQDPNHDSGSDPQAPHTGLQTRKTRCRPADVVSNPFFVTVKSESHDEAGARSPRSDGNNNNSLPSSGSDSTNSASHKQEPRSSNVKEPRTIPFPSQSLRVETPEGTSGYQCDSSNVKELRRIPLLSQPFPVVTPEGKSGYKCAMCGKMTLRLSSMRCHMKVHLDGRLLKCKFCGKAYTEPARLADHEQSEHAGERPYRCDVCGLTFTKLLYLKRHGITHTDYRPHMCNVCGRKFREKPGLRQHMLLHTGEKPHSCSLCGKAFTQYSSLYKHMRSHTGEKPHQCAVCGKQFSGSVMLHMRRHTGERPYKCDVCGKAFFVMCDLKQHARIHTNERPYQCGVCGKGFSVSGKMRRHEQTHSDERPHGCHICGKAFKHLYNLKEHLKTQAGHAIATPSKT